MIDELITFETAKLAKEKGFDLDLPIRYFRIGTKIVDAHIAFADNADEELGQAPTQSLLQRWLREKHEIHVVVHLEDIEEDWNKPAVDQYTWSICKGKLGSDTEHILAGKTFLKYEEELEKGLYNALKLIK